MIKKTLAAATLLAVGATTMTASAQLALKGSDTLEPVVSDVLATKCSAATLNAVLTYVGGGSGGGENAMGAGTQLIAPMSSAMSATGANCALTNANTRAQGMVLGLDGIAMVVDSGSSETCGDGHASRGATPAADPTPPFTDFRNSGTAPGTTGYQVGTNQMTGNNAWKDILRLLYTGIDNNTATGVTPAGTVAQRCGTQQRRDLADHYDSLYQNGCATNNCTNGIKHAYRRNDLSGTTDTFLSLIGAPKITKDAAGNVTATPFCNGLENEDNDPIRRPCDAGEQVCEYDGTLGFLVPISVPTVSNDPTVLFNGDKLPTALRFLTAQPPTCDFGPQWIVPGVVAAPATLAAQNSSRCDCRFPIPNDFVTAGVDQNGAPTGSPVKNSRFNWNTRVGGRCQVPTTTTVSSTARWGLINGDDGGRDNTPPGWGTRYDDGTGFTKCCAVQIAGVATQVTEDPRALNFALRNPTGGNYLSNAAGQQIQVSFHRMHATSNGKLNVGAAAATPTALCQRTDATENIGCMVEFPTTDTCSVGFAGLDASKKVFAERAALRVALGAGSPVGVDPTTPSIQCLIDPTITTGQPCYPFSRKLYLNSLFGFNNIGESNGTHTGNLTTFTPGSGSIDGQYNLSKCMYSDFALGATSSIQKVGFVPLPANGGKPFCENACGSTACISGDATVAGSFDNVFSR